MAAVKVQGVCQYTDKVRKRCLRIWVVPQVLSPVPYLGQDFVFLYQGEKYVYFVKTMACLNCIRHYTNKQEIKR